MLFVSKVLNLLIKHVPVPFLPESARLKVNDHPIELFLHGKILPQWKSSEGSEYHFFGNVERIISETNMY